LPSRHPINAGRLEVSISTNRLLKNFVTHRSRLEPHLALVPGDGPDETKDEVRDAANEETKLPAEDVHIRCSLIEGRRTRLIETLHEPRERKQEANDKRHKRMDIRTTHVIVQALAGGRVHIRERQVPTPQEEIVHEHDGHNRALEDGVAVEEVEEAAGRGDDAPGDNGKGEEQAEELAADDVEVGGEQTGDVRCKGDEVAGDGGAERGKSEACGGEKDARACRRGVAAVEDAV
jgi:hypothetical protein